MDASGQLGTAPVRPAAPAAPRRGAAASAGRSTRLLADAVAVLSVGLLAVAVAVAVAVATATGGDPGGRGPLLELVDNGSLPFVAAFGGVGWLLARRRPRNPIGWCFATGALVWALAALDGSWVALRMAQGDTGPLVRAAAVAGSYAWLWSMPLSVQLPLLLLPDGRLLSSRWRPLVWAVVAGVSVGTAGFLTLPGTVENVDPPLVNPLGVRWAGPLPPALAWTGAGLLLVALAGGVVSAVLRSARSSGPARQQMRWVALGGVCVVLGALAGEVVGGTPFESVLGTLGITAVPVCVGTAVLRYRLYELERLVSRTVSYAVVTAALLGVYVTLVTVSVRLLSVSSSLAVAGATLAAAALFRPLLRRVQAAVDRRFDRSRYDAVRTVTAFRGRLREVVDLDAVRADLVGVVWDTVHPASVGLWLRDGGPGTPPGEGRRPALPR